ncbi:hypothetical protein ASZ90_015998 [hydrocarbon metagenome]|uniref:Uncharacterized protein n=1 Tax=hydrocarbon metagenome TaxID=938273 RepID=A0A0W8F0F6_9ZZZZ
MIETGEVPEFWILMVRVPESSCMNIAGSSVTSVIATCDSGDPVLVVSAAETMVHIPAMMRNAARTTENSILRFRGGVLVIIQILHTMVGGTISLSRSGGEEGDPGTAGADGIMDRRCSTGTVMSFPGIGITTSCQDRREILRAPCRQVR